MRILVVDAFTDRAFAGNPAGVCLLESPADAAWMQQVAAEMRHSETAFVRPLSVPDADYELRWFTPLVEVALCGHATLATAHALYETGTVRAGMPIRFQSRKSGVLTVTTGSDGLLEMDFPAQPARPVPVPAGLAEALGVPVTEVGRNAQNDLLIVLEDEQAVRNLTPDMTALARIDARGICVTAPAAVSVTASVTASAVGSAGESVAAGSAACDFVSRFFGASVGVGEDPVTGSAHCMLAPYWSERLGRDELTGYQASERAGTVRVIVRGDRVTLAGRAVTILDGTLKM
jgi:PhzF family phenazine biosynthesis protein